MHDYCNYYKNDDNSINDNDGSEPADWRNVINVYSSQVATAIKRRDTLS